MTFSLRDARPGDLGAIVDIYRESVLNGTASYEILPPDEPEMASRFAAIINKGYPYVVASGESGAVLGYAYASPFRTRPAYRWLVEDSIYLAPEARGRGIGGALLSTLLDRCSELGFRQMIAVIGGAHPASVALHRSAGFNDAGLLRGSGYKFGRWLDTVLMQKTLGEGTATDPDPSAYPGTLFRK
jgi:phosphinothricin acetyltransferase